MADELGFCAEHGKFGLGAPICPTCAVKASNELKALRAEFGALKATCTEWERRACACLKIKLVAWKENAALRAEVAALKAMYAEPLTDEQATSAMPAIGFHLTPSTIKLIDAAIQAAREGK